MRFQERDGEILVFIWENDGVVALEHLHRKFWPGKTLRAVQARVQKLAEADYLARPTRKEYMIRPVPQPVVWLDWRGILYIAHQRGVTVREPKNPAVENQLRKFSKRLRKQGINWVRTPRWGKLPHDLKVIDFRLAVEEAAGDLPWLNLEEWITETPFRADMDVIDYRVTGKRGIVKEGRRGVVPDGYFVVSDENRRARGKPFLARYLLELDMATHSNPSFARDKVAPYVAYIKSRQYRNRFGSNKGMWLVVTTGKRRMKHLMQGTDRTVGDSASAFSFTTLDAIKGANALTDPVWRRVGRKKPLPLMTFYQAE